MYPLLAAGAILAGGVILSGCLSNKTKVDEVCEGAPTYGEITTEPKYNYAYTDPDREPVVYTIYDIANSCDDSIVGITATADFGTEGTEEVTLEPAADGSLIATITHRFEKEFQGIIWVTITGKNGEETKLELYAPYAASSGCESSMKPTISSDAVLIPSAVSVNESFDLCLPMEGIEACDGTSAAEDPARFYMSAYVANQWIYDSYEYYPTEEEKTAYGLETSVDSYYCVTREGISLYGSYNYTIAIEDLNYADYHDDNVLETYPESFYVKAIAAPTCMLVGLEGSYHDEDQDSTIGMYCSEVDTNGDGIADAPTIDWEIVCFDAEMTRYDYSASGETPFAEFPFTFYEGSCVFTATATGEGYDPVIETSDAIRVYDKSTSIPQVIISGLASSVTCGDTVVGISAYSDQDVSVDWIILKNGGTIDTFSDQAELDPYTFACDTDGEMVEITTNFSLKATVTNTDNTDLTNYAIQAVGAYPETTTAPAAIVAIPYSATISSDGTSDNPYTISISVDDPDAVYFEIDWGTGDGFGVEELVDDDGDGTGTITHYFTEEELTALLAADTYGVGIQTTVQVMVVDADVSSNFALYDQDISISYASTPMPVLTISHNPSTGATSGYYIYFDFSGSSSPDGYAITGYELTFGDGNIETGTDITGVIFHQYENPGPGNSAYYTGTLVITDDHGGENSMNFTVSVWGDDA